VAVEFAVIGIPLFLILLGGIEFGRGLMTVQTMEESARAGVRAAMIRGVTAESIEAEVDRMLRVTGIDQYTVTVEPSNFKSADRFTPITVTVSATYDDISWIPVPRFLGGAKLIAQSTMPKESPPDQ